MRDQAETLRNLVQNRANSHFKRVAFISKKDDKDSALLLNVLNHYSDLAHWDLYFCTHDIFNHEKSSHALCLIDDDLKSTQLKELCSKNSLNKVGLIVKNVTNLRDSLRIYEKVTKDFLKYSRVKFDLIGFINPDRKIIQRVLESKTLIDFERSGTEALSLKWLVQKLERWKEA